MTDDVLSLSEDELRSSEDEGSLTDTDDEQVRGWLAAEKAAPRARGCLDTVVDCVFVLFFRLMPPLSFSIWFANKTNRVFPDKVFVLPKDLILNPETYTTFICMERLAFLFLVAVMLLAFIM